MDFKVKINRRNYSDDELLDDLKKIAKKIKKSTLSHAEYKTKGGSFGVNTFLRKFGSWNKAINKAGLSQSQIRNTPFTNEQLFENLAEMWIKMGRQPTYDDFQKDISICTIGPYVRTFKSWNNALVEFSKYINSGKNFKKSDIEKAEVQTTKNDPRKINLRLRWLVMDRDRFTCVKCGRSRATGYNKQMHVDHIHPYSKGGKTKLDNLQTLCFDCNLGKSDLI